MRGNEISPITGPGYCLERVSKLQYREEEPRWDLEVCGDRAGGLGSQVSGCVSQDRVPDQRGAQGGLSEIYSEFP